MKKNTQYALYQCEGFCYPQTKDKYRTNPTKIMAIQFARLQYVQRSKGQSSCQKAAYNQRARIYDLRQNKTYDYTKRGDCEYHAMLLPEGASEMYQESGTLWNAIEAIESREDSQVAKEMVLALPDDAVITVEDRIALTRSFLEEHFVRYGIICQIDIHGPHHSQSKKTKEDQKEVAQPDADDRQNWHAHVLMPTRPCHNEAFGLKARNLDVDIRKGMVVSTDKQWGVLWANHQNAYFRENGIDLVVDPVGVIPEMHLGPVRMRWKGHKKALEDEREEIQKENQRQAQDERQVMRQLLQHESTFEKKDVEIFVRKHIADEERREDFLGRFWSSQELVLVGEGKYTSKTVLQEEQKMMRMADRLNQRQMEIIEPQCTIELNEEQKFVVDHICSGSNFCCIEGKAGTGKSRVLHVLRETYEAEGFTVRGLAPTSAVADDLRHHQFKYASNIHSFLFRSHHDRIDLDRNNEIWLVDEAAMISTSVMGELLDKAWRVHAKVVLVGDEQQLSSIDRGGAFKVFTERFGSASLETILRQKTSDDRVITDKIAGGQTKEALDLMQENGRWIHCTSEFDAVQAMVKQWYDDYREHPMDSFMILEYRNQFVKEFNKHVHAVLKARGDVGSDEIMINTTRYGFANFSVGDAIVFRQNDSERNIHNGQRGFLIQASEREFVVRVDDQRDIVFDPEVYMDFQHGYAGTIHSSQGLTFDHVYALHSDHINQNLFYVANSRHRLSCHYFSYGDKEKVYQSVLQSDHKTLTTDTIEDTPRNWLCSLVVSFKDYMTTNHEFYNSSDRYYDEQGVLITNKKEDEFLKGYRTLYREDQKTWPDLDGVSVRTSSKNKDLEPFLREQGVSQCILLDANRNESQLIGPYDRFHDFCQEHFSQFRDQDLTETQFRVRLFALEKQFNESPQSSQEMVQSRAYEALMDHETTLKPELLKEHDEHMTIQILHHLEKTGDMPTSKELKQIQQRVTVATQQFSSHQADHIFTAALPKEDQKQVQFQKQMEMER